MDLFDTVVQYEVRLWNALDRALKAAGLISAADVHALRSIHRRPGAARVRDLSSDIGITVGAASKVVDRLERDGLVTRGPNPTDRRSSLIGFTAAGEAALHDASLVRERVMREVLEGPAADSASAALATLLTKLERFEEETIR